MGHGRFRRLKTRQPLDDIKLGDGRQAGVGHGSSQSRRELERESFETEKYWESKEGKQAENIELQWSTVHVFINVHVHLTWHTTVHVVGTKIVMQYGDHTQRISLSLNVDLLVSESPQPSSSSSLRFLGQVHSI
jgi:hypothetical protein